MDKEYIFKLTTEDANNVVKALSELPFKESYVTINKLQRQYAEQTVTEKNPKEEILMEDKKK